MVNPYAVTTTELADTTHRIPSQEIPQSFRSGIVIILALMVIGTLAACFHIETIIFSGPMLFLIGVAVAFQTRQGEQRKFQFLAWGCILFPILCLFLINSFNLSPRDARVPISVLTVLFSMLMFGISMNALARSPVLQRSPTDLAMASHSAANVPESADSAKRPATAE